MEVLYFQAQKKALDVISPWAQNKTTGGTRAVVFLFFFTRKELWELRLEEKTTRSAQSTAKKQNKKACIKTNPNMISRFIV